MAECDLQDDGPPCPRRCIPSVTATMPPLLPVITPVYIFSRYMIPSKCRFAVFTVHNPTINAHNGTGCHRFPGHLHYTSMGTAVFLNSTGPKGGCDFMASCKSLLSRRFYVSTFSTYWPEKPGYWPPNLGHKQ